jgi:YggT family protein
MIAATLTFLVSTLFGLFAVALLLRFYLQWVRAAYRNPLSEFLNALTNFIVLPARRVIPGLWGLDLATLLSAWFAKFLELLIVLQLRGHEFGPAAGSVLAGLALLAAVMVIKLALYIVMIVVLVQAVLSWIHPHSPLAPLLNSMSRPFLRVFRNLIPPVGNVDLSPLFVIIACQLLLMLPVAYLELTVSQLFR